MADGIISPSFDFHPLNHDSDPSVLKISVKDGIANIDTENCNKLLINGRDIISELNELIGLKQKLEELTDIVNCLPSVGPEYIKAKERFEKSHKS